MTGTVSGVALAPGISRNGRLYTKDNITKAYERLNARVNDPNASPVVMRTHHGAGDDSTRIVAQVNKVTLDDNAVLRYKADFADTTHAETIRALAKPDDDGKPALAHVSIYGWWMDEPTTVEVDGQKVETGDDLEIDFIDFTASPGVLAATATAESARHRNAINESHDVEITVTEPQQAVIDAPEAKRYADHGFRDGVKRLPIDTIEQVHHARTWLSVESNRAHYTERQVDRIRKSTENAARKLGAKVNREGWVISGRPLTETEVKEYYADLILVDDDICQPASFCFDASNGPINVCISSWCLDPADLEVAVNKAVAAITLALQGFDPDMDGDLDVGVADTKAPDVLPDAGDQMETTTPPAAVTETAPTDPAAPAAVTEALATAPAEDTTPKEPAMAESTTEGATATAVAPEIDYGKLAEAMVAATEKAAAEKKAADDKAAAEASAAETATATEAQLREAITKDVTRELLKELGSGVVQRKGAGLAEQTEAGDPSGKDLWEKRGEIFVGVAHDNAQRFGTARV